MAKEQALQFIIRINKDRALQSKLLAFADKGVEGIVNVGREAGFDFTVEEFQSVAYEQWEASQAAEISEGELDSIAGGQGIPGQPGPQNFAINVVRNLTPPPPGGIVHNNGMKW